MVAFARPALGCAHTVGFTDVFIARDGPPQPSCLTPGNCDESCIEVCIAVAAGFCCLTPGYCDESCIDVCIVGSAEFCCLTHDYCDRLVCMMLTWCH